MRWLLRRDIRAATATFGTLTLERGPVVVFAHLSPVTSVEALDTLVAAGLVNRESRDELDLAALGRGQYTMRRVTIYTLK